MEEALEKRKRSVSEGHELDNQERRMLGPECPTKQAEQVDVGRLQKRQRQNNAVSSGVE